MAISFGITDLKIALGDEEIGKISLADVLVYASGSTVTYYVDSNASYTEEVDSEATCLSPKTFTPAKDGWTFVGWREDTTASSSVLSSKVMGDSPITLYAVFRQTVTVTYHNNSTNASTTSGTRYYNNGNVVNPSFTLTQDTRNGWSARGWSTGTIGNAGVTYSNGVEFERDSNITLYGLYQQTVTVTYYTVSDTTKKTATGMKYYNSSGNTVNPRFTINPTGYGMEWTFRGWTTGITANANVKYESINNTEIVSSVTLYIVLQQTITLKTVVRGETSSHTGILYLNSYGANTVLVPKFTVANPTISGMTFRGWSTSASSITVSYNSISNLELYGNTTLYAVATYPDVAKEDVSFGSSSESCWNNATHKTYFTDIDASKYSGIKITYWHITLNTDFKDSWTALYISDGTNKAEVAYTYCNGSEQVNQRQNFTPTLTFAKSSGTVSVSLISEGGSSTMNYAVYGNVYTLIGRTTVG